MKGLKLAPDKRYSDTRPYRHGVGAMHWLVGTRRKMTCLNYIVASLQCAQCRKYATHICGISFPIWLAIFGVCIPKRDAQTYTRNENSVTIMCLALRRSAIKYI